MGAEFGNVHLDELTRKSISSLSPKGFSDDSARLLDIFESPDNRLQVFEGLVGQK